VHAHSVSRNIGDRLIEGSDIHRDDLTEIGKALIEIHGVAKHREVGTTFLSG
jgi:hypothetical protein